MDQTVFTLTQKIKENIKKVIVGKDSTIDLMLACLLSGGHMLLEDVPGTGKTKLVKALSASINCSSKRIQFTPDLLPSDITGIKYFNMKSSEFEFVPGPIFTNILLADEINRATPKTQAGLLECMEECQATIEGTTYPLATPFMVIATQNPIENLGVFPLPEAELDRFLIKTSMNLPTKNESIQILSRFSKYDPLDTLEPVATANDIVNAAKTIPNIFIHNDLVNYIVEIVDATHNADNVELGVSPRGAIALQKISKAFAAISNRNYVIPDDIKKACVPVLSHRLILSSSARIRKGSDIQTIENIVKTVTVPTESQLFWSGK